MMRPEAAVALRARHVLFVLVPTVLVALLIAMTI
jgi:hypothetical protein